MLPVRSTSFNLLLSTDMMYWKIIQKFNYWYLLKGLKRKLINSLLNWKSKDFFLLETNLMRFLFLNSWWSFWWKWKKTRTVWINQYTGKYLFLWLSLPHSYTIRWTFFHRSKQAPLAYIIPPARLVSSAMWISSIKDNYYK